MLNSFTKGGAILPIKSYRTMTREQYIVASLEQSYKSLKDAYSALAGCSSDTAIKNLRAEIEALESKVQAEYEKRYN